MKLEVVFEDVENDVVIARKRGNGQLFVGRHSSGEDILMFEEIGSYALGTGVNGEQWLESTTPPLSSYVAEPVDLDEAASELLG
jgi:hypothetical protein